MLAYQAYRDARKLVGESVISSVSNFRS